MARLCVRILPNEHPTDPALTALRTQPGDVVCVVDDGHVFSHAELNCGHYRIIDVPGVPQEELIRLCAHVKGADKRTLKRRQVKLDDVALKSAQWSGKTIATKAQIASITVTKA